MKIITGDNLVTTTAIAKQADFRGWEKGIDGAELSALNQKEFDKAVLNNNIFTRMFPEVKLKIIQGLKRQNQ